MVKHFKYCLTGRPFHTWKTAVRRIQQFNCFNLFFLTIAHTPLIDPRVRLWFLINVHFDNYILVFLFLWQSVIYWRNLSGWINATWTASFLANSSSPHRYASFFYDKLRDGKKIYHKHFLMTNSEFLFIIIVQLSRIVHLIA